MINDLDTKMKEDISKQINSNFLLPVFILNEDNGKPNIIFSQNRNEGNIYAIIKTFEELIEKYYKKNIKREKSLDKIKNFKLNEDNADEYIKYETNVFNNKKDIKSGYGILLSEMSKYVNFVVNIDNDLMSQISIDYDYSDLSEEKFVKNLLKNMVLPFRLNFKTNIAIEIVNSGGKLNNFYDNFYEEKIEEIEENKEIKIKIEKSIKKIKENRMDLDLKYNTKENLTF